MKEQIEYFIGDVRLYLEANEQKEIVFASSDLGINGSSILLGGRQTYRELLKWLELPENHRYTLGDVRIKTRKGLVTEQECKKPCWIVNAHGQLLTDIS